MIDWDPSKWIILALEKFGLVTSLRRARDEDLVDALNHMHKKEVLGMIEPEDDSWDGKIWNLNQVKEFAQSKPGSCIVLIDGFAVDVTVYLGEHVRYVGPRRVHLIDVSPARWSEYSTEAFCAATG